MRLVAAALQNAELDAELRRTVDELRRSNAELRARGPGSSPSPTPSGAASSATSTTARRRT